MRAEVRVRIAISRRGESSQGSPSPETEVSKLERQKAGLRAERLRCLGESSDTPRFTNTCTRKSKRTRVERDR